MDILDQDAPVKMDSIGGHQCSFRANMHSIESEVKKHEPNQHRRRMQWDGMQRDVVVNYAIKNLEENVT